MRYLFSKLNASCFSYYTLLLCEACHKDFSLRKSDGTILRKDDEIVEILDISKRSWSTIKKELISHNVIVKSKVDRSFKVNPIYLMHDDNYMTKEIFDLFHNPIKDNLHELEYLKLKSNWYEVNHEICVKKYSDLTKKISGIYRLYKNNEIIYIGKSICIKSRLTQHKSEKDTDSFDFTILNNESDKNIYELYYIDKYKPTHNRDCIEKSTSNIELEDLVFSNIIKL